MSNNYVNGNFNGSNEYDLVINGSYGNYNKSAVMLGNTTNYGRMMYDNSVNAAYLDVSGNQSSATILHRQTSDGSTFNNMLTLVVDNLSSNTTYAGSFGGRALATQFVLAGNDTRLPQAYNVGVSQNNGQGMFNVNKGAVGVGGFQFNTYNSNGSLSAQNMVLAYNGQVNIPYYTGTADPNDSESVAVAGFDASGNLVRNYAANERLRLAESRLSSIENDLIGNGTLPAKVNDIINRLNGLNFFSSNITTIPISGNTTQAFGYVVNPPTSLNAVKAGSLQLTVAWNAPVPSTPAPGQATSYLITWTGTAGNASWAGNASAGYPPVNNVSGTTGIVVPYSSVVLTFGTTGAIYITVSSQNSIVQGVVASQNYTGISNSASISGPIYVLS